MPDKYPSSLNLMNEDECKRLLFAANQVAITSGALLRALDRGQTQGTVSCASKLKTQLADYGQTVAALYEQQNQAGSSSAKD